MVFFDAGETLLRPYPSFGELFAATAVAHGVPIEVDEVNDVRRRLAPFLLELAEDSGVEQPSLLPERSYDFWGYVYRRFLAELQIEDETLVRRLFDVFSDSASYKLYDDSLPTLLELQQRGYRLGLISNFEGWLEKLLIELEVGHLFDTTVISAVEGIEKPDPAIYHLALERSGALPGRSAMVGDSPANDAEPSAQVGMVPVLLDRSGSYATLSGYTKVVSLKELPDVLENL
jgi:putative hydrolase of the HAD superfamily